MSRVENEETVRRLFEAFYAADDAALDAMLGPDFMTHGPGGGTGDAAGWKAMAHQIAAAVPDNRTEIVDIFGTDDKVVVRYTSRGTHTGELFGISRWIARRRRRGDVWSR